MSTLGRARAVGVNAARHLVGTVSRSHNPAVRWTYTNARLAARHALNAVSGRRLGWVSTLWSVRWVRDDALGDDILEVRGWAYERGYGFPDAPPSTEVWLERGAERIAASVTPIVEPEVNARASRSGDFDYANTAFIARFDLSDLRTRETDDATPWITRIRVGGAKRTVEGGFRNRYNLASAGHLFARTADGVQILPRWASVEGGLLVSRSRPRALAGRVSVDGRRVSITVDTGGAPLRRAEMVTEEVVADLDCRPAQDGGWVLEGDLPTTRSVVLTDPAHAAQRRFRVFTDAGAELPVQTDLDDALLAAGPDTTLIATSWRSGELVLLDAPRQAVVDTVVYEPDPEPALRLTGRIYGADATFRAQFWSPRQVLPGQLSVNPDRTFELHVPLLASVWGERPLPPRLGGYRIQIRAADKAGSGGRRIPVYCSPDLTVELPRKHDDAPLFMFRMQSGPRQRFQFRVSPPRRPDEMGQFHVRRMSAEYLKKDWQPRDAVYFESFYGRNATCNPRALDAVIAREHPELRRIWGVVDGSVPVPEGAVAVIQGTREWWEARATSRWVIANDWLRSWFVRQPFQIVLQTWHGSMFKRIGLDRPKVPREKRRILVGETKNWDLLLSQNAHSTEIFASAYAWNGPILQEGYPRDDPLAHADGSAIRERLGIGEGKTAILYAPTWRENLEGMVAFLDLERLCADLGEDYVLLLRGHSRTVEFGQSVQVPGLIDVTTYPEITDLFLAADALITDYSSVMFDYSVTRRPMIFFTPDMSDYRDTLRGTYFDLEDLAPGPVLSTQQQVTEAIRSLDTQTERYLERYERWLATFNSYDDGHSGERVVKRLMAIRKVVAPNGTSRLEM